MKNKFQGCNLFKITQCVHMEHSPQPLNTERHMCVHTHTQCTILSSANAVSPPPFSLGTTSCVRSSGVPSVEHSRAEGIRKRRGGILNLPTHWQLQFLWTEPKKILAQGSLAAHVEPWVVRTNFGPHVTGTSPHSALHQVKPQDKWSMVGEPLLLEQLWVLSCSLPGPTLSMCPAKLSEATGDAGPGFL